MRRSAGGSTRLQALARRDGPEMSRIQRHLDTLRQEAQLAAADEVAAKLGRLKCDPSPPSRELAAGTPYLERLQTSVAAKAWKAREQAEAAIGDVRSRRIAVDERLAQARDAAATAWQEQRKRVSAARDELEQKADRTVQRS